jgi:serine/threonine protein kinase
MLTNAVEPFVQNHSRMAEHDAALVVMDVLHVLAECNRQKVCYADIKPANILLKRRYPDVQLSRLSNCQVLTCSSAPACCWFSLHGLMRAHTLAPTGAYLVFVLTGCAARGARYRLWLLAVCTGWFKAGKADR